MHRLVILVDDDSTKEERDAVTKAIDRMHVEWWHWFHYAWLVKDSRDRPVLFWREVVQALIPNTVGFVVLQVTAQDAAYWINEDGAEWIKDDWMKD
jgi:hypothetical protein